MARFDHLLGAIYAPPPTPADVDAEVESDDESTESADDGGSDVFDPSAHSIKDVLAYIESHQDDAERVRAAESAGKARKGILDAQA